MKVSLFGCPVYCATSKRKVKKEFQEERKVQRRRSEEGSCVEASRSLSGWSLVKERVTCLSVLCLSVCLPAATAALTPSGGSECECEGGGGVAGWGRHHSKRRGGGGAPLHSPLSCLSQASHQPLPPLHSQAPLPLWLPGDAAQGQLGSNGGQRGREGSGWGQFQQCLDCGAHLDQAALLQDVMGQTQFVLRGEERRSRSAKHI